MARGLLNFQKAFFESENYLGFPELSPSELKLQKLRKFLIKIEGSILNESFSKSKKCY